jgi:hypothetical protein
MGGWATLCGALASNHLRWEGQALLTLALVLLLADLAWGSLWDLATGTDWFRLIAGGSFSERSKMLAALPYTQPDSAGGRLSLRLGRFAGWWREVFWPAAGPSLLGLLAATALVVVLSLLLSARLRLLTGGLVALIGLGLVQRKRGKEPMAGHTVGEAKQAMVLVGFSWLAGHLAFAEMEWASLILALGFTIAAWGVLWAARGRTWGLWLLNAGQVVCVAVMVLQKQPLVAGVIGLLFFGPLALQLVLHTEDDSARSGLADRVWPWLMLSMLVSALALA